MTKRKKCTKCGKIKTLNLKKFRFLNYHNMFCAQCRECERKSSKRWHDENVELHGQMTRQWELENPEKNKAIRKKSKAKHYKKNRTEILKKKKEYNAKPEVKARKNANAKAKRKKDPILKLRNRVSSAVAEGLRAQNSSKRGSSVWKFLNYSPKELAIYLESLFEPWMNWDNYGVYRVVGERKWHLDHIVPLLDLPFDSMKHPNFKKAWKLSNLRPLDAVQNIIDGASRSRHKKKH